MAEDEVDTARTKSLQYSVLSVANCIIICADNHSDLYCRYLDIAASHYNCISLDSVSFKKNCVPKRIVKYNLLILALKVILLDRLQGINCSVIQEP